MGLGYSADVGGVGVALGLSAGEETLAGSIGASVGGLAFGVNYAMEEIGTTSEYVAAGVSYTAGALSIGTGAETEIRHGHGANPRPFTTLAATGQEMETNYFVGASYEVADGLALKVGVANLDSDSENNWSETCFNRSGRGVNFNGIGCSEGRSWTAGASVTVDF